MRYLDDNSPCALTDIVDALTDYETDSESNWSSHRQAVYVSMYQSHILKLDASDIVEYDDRSKDVATGPRHRRAMEILSCIEDPTT